MTITTIPTDILDLFVRYSRNYRSCLIVSKNFNASVQRVFSEKLRVHFNIANSTSPYKTFQRKKIECYGAKPDKGLPVYGAPFRSAASTNSVYALVFETSVRVFDRRSNTTVCEIPSPSLLREVTFNNQNKMIILSCNKTVSLQESVIQTSNHKYYFEIIPYNLAGLHCEGFQNYILINKEGKLHFFNIETREFIPTTLPFTKRIFYKDYQLVAIFNEEYIIYDCLNHRVQATYKGRSVVNIIDFDEDFIIEEFDECYKITNGTNPTQVYSKTEWVILGFDCFLYRGDSNSSIRYYFTKNENILSNFTS